MLPSNYKSSLKQAKHWSSDSYLCNHIYKWLSVSGPDATCDTKLGASHDNMSSLMLSLVSVRKLRAMIIFHFTLSLWVGAETVLVLSNISTKSSVSCDCLIKTQTASCCLLAEFSESSEIPARSYFVCRALEKSVLCVWCSEIVYDVLLCHSMQLTIKRHFWGNACNWYCICFWPKPTF